MQNDTKFIVAELTKIKALLDTSLQLHAINLTKGNMTHEKAISYINNLLSKNLKEAEAEIEITNPDMEKLIENNLHIHRIFKFEDQ